MIQQIAPRFGGSLGKAICAAGVAGGAILVKSGLLATAAAVAVPVAVAAIPVGAAVAWAVKRRSSNR